MGCPDRPFEKMKTKLKIEKFRNTGKELFATIEGIEVRLTTFREGFMAQGAVYLPPPFTDRCESMIFTDAYDHDSQLVMIKGLISDHEVAGWMKLFCEGKLKKGILR